MKTQREFLKSDLWDKWQESLTDQKKKIPLPPIQKPYPEDADLIDLIPADELTIGKDTNLYDAINQRKSWRKYADDPLNIEELSFLLWATQGVQEMIRSGKFSRRTVPSGGCRHPFETYLLINRVTGLEPGIYRYLPLDHKLLYLYNEDGLIEKVNDSFMGQYIKGCAVAFMWTTIPYRTEWRYTFLSPKIIAQDSGHLCQNLYLACAAIGAGTCAIGAYDQDKMDAVLRVDGVDEFAVYGAPVGKIKPAK
ncbi:MAG: SagB/ThcOx family dehydrogenase [Anaerolineaceae bacterium]|nr:SagB/ThcOx family dehydrogenase [Anaerolineaceae bacterium]